MAVGDEIVSTRRNCDPNSELLVDLSASLDEFYDSAEIVLVGDFNPSDIDWSTNSVLRDPDANCRLMDFLLHHLCHNKC